MITWALTTKELGYFTGNLLIFRVYGLISNRSAMHIISLAQILQYRIRPSVQSVGVSVETKGPQLFYGYRISK